MAWVSQAEWWDAYRSYLDSEKWQEFRQLALLYYGQRCNRCHRWRNQLGPDEWLEVDHLHYRTLYNETLGDVQILCNTCHKRKTVRSRRMRKIKRLLRI
jgi:5-methylcytosine-specific restriction endonuclease McrA